MHCKPLLEKLGDELRFVMLTSEVHLKPLADAANAESTELDGLNVAVFASEYQKCERCWHHRPGRWPAHGPRRSVRSLRE